MAGGQDMPGGKTRESSRRQAALEFTRRLRREKKMVVYRAEHERLKAIADVVDSEAITTFTFNPKLGPVGQLGAIIDWHIKVATDPRVNGGYVLVKENEDGR